MSFENHAEHLDETFAVLRQYQMMLHSECAFSTAACKFLGFMVNHIGIKANTEEILATRSMHSPKRGKDNFTKYIVALNQFVSRSIDICYHSLMHFDGVKH